jgi:hypothetical protein
MASTGPDRVIRVFDLTAGEFVATIRSDGCQFLSLVFHPQEKLLAACTETRSVHFFDLDQICEVKGGFVIGNCAPRCVRFSQEGNILASSSPSTISLFRTDAPEFADHLQLGVANVHDLQLYSTGVAIAVSDGGYASMILARTSDFRLMKKTEEKPQRRGDRTKSAPNSKVIDGNNLNRVPEAAVPPPPPPPQKPKRVVPQKVAVEAHPAKPATAVASSANDPLFRAFKVSRPGYLAGVAQRLSRLTHLKDVIKKKGFGHAASEVASSGVGVEEFMTILMLRPESVRIDNAPACIDSLQFGFKVNPELAAVGLQLILSAVGTGLSVVKGGEEAAAVMTTLHSITPVVASAADNGSERAKKLLETWPKLLR